MKINKYNNSFVNHPRYGNKPIISDYVLSKEEIEYLMVCNTDEVYFLETALLADTTKQHYNLYPRKIYIDEQIKCNQCHRLFIFFAIEQKAWFEKWNLYIDAKPKKCWECRKKEKEIKTLQFDYEQLVVKKHRTLDENKELKKYALELYQLGIIKKKRRIDDIPIE